MYPGLDRWSARVWIVNVSWQFVMSLLPSVCPPPSLPLTHWLALWRWTSLVIMIRDFLCRDRALVSSQATWGVWIPKIDTATQPFLGLMDMRNGTFLKLTWRHEAFLKSTGHHDVFLKSTGRQCHFLKSTGRQCHFLKSTGWLYHFL